MLSAYVDSAEANCQLTSALGLKLESSSFFHPDLGNAFHRTAPQAPFLDRSKNGQLFFRYALSLFFSPKFG